MSASKGRVHVLRVAILSVSLCCVATVAHAAITITLKNTFIERYKDRATIQTPYVVDKAHKRANTASKDGDLYIAGRGNEIGLATVAEIMNAATEANAVDAIHAIE